MKKEVKEVTDEMKRKEENMIKGVDAMVHKKRGGPLDIDNAMFQSSEETKKILGVSGQEAIPNKYLKRLKEIPTIKMEKP